jgi:glycosyltransferase involved in cell wall biosynthesis
MHISYWCPFLGDVATISSVKNSIKSIRKFSKKKIKIDLINYFDEWFLLKEFFSSKYNLNLIDFYNYNLLKFLPKNGFIKSRVTFLAMFFLAIFPLHNYLKNKKPDFFIVHLLTSLPLILLLLFNFKSKFILRVSGLPKINFLRKYLWGIAGKKLFKITVPTIDTKKMLLDLNIFPEDKIIILRDPIFSIYEILQKKKEKINSNYKNFFVAIGRLTTQKNHQILLKAFSELIKEKDCTSNLLILGSALY